MTYKEQLLNSYLSKAKQAEKILKKKGIFYANSSFIWQILQLEFDIMDSPSDLLFKDLSLLEIVDIILNHKEKHGQPICEIVIERSILTSNFDDSLIKAIIKLKGEKWVVHKHDKDSFPSNPHAHNYRTNTKIHLGSGQIFRKKEVCGQVKKKDILLLRKRIQQQLPSLTLPNLEIY